MTAQSSVFGPPLEPEKQNVLPAAQSQPSALAHVCTAHIPPRSTGQRELRENGRSGEARTRGVADVDDGVRVGGARGEDVPGGVDVRRALAVRELELDVGVLADVALVHDRLLRALDRARGADERGGRAGDGGEDGEEGEDTHGCWLAVGWGVRADLGAARRLLGAEDEVW